MNRILDQHGRPYANGRARHNGHSRADLIDLAVAARPRAILARYDAALTTTDNQRHWAGADALDADRSNSVAVRRPLVWRSRYEIANNAYAKGIVLTHANYVIGTGPVLRMQTTSPAFNAMVERLWSGWASKIRLPQKLRTMAMAKVGDGEAIGLCGTNPRLNDRVKLDIRLIETEQMTTPFLEALTPGSVDGIRFDAWGNPLSYDILPYHPGGYWAGWNTAEALTPQVWPAKYVMHWFRVDRPGQHRGVPELTAGLNLFASSRRYREAVIAAAESLADFTLLLKTNAPPNDGPDEVRPLSTLPIDKRMMTALPSGWDAFQPRAEQPSSQYGEFMDRTHNEEARPINMPRNIATCDSSGYNFASGKLDHMTYFVSVEVERTDAEAATVDPLFALWFEEAVQEYGWAQGPGMTPPHSWDWPPRPQIDDLKQAEARKVALMTGAISLDDVWIEDGKDPDVQLQRMADRFGVTVEAMQSALFNALFLGQIKNRAIAQEAVQDAP